MAITTIFGWVGFLRFAIRVLHGRGGGGGNRAIEREHTEVLEESCLVPGDAFVDVGRGVREPFGLARVAAKNAMEVGTDFVRLTSADGVALCASGLEERGALRSVTCNGITAAVSIQDSVFFILASSCPVIVIG